MKKNKIFISLVGAGGKMGNQITNNLKNRDEYITYYCEKSKQGIENLREKELSNSTLREAIPKSNYIILAVPDTKIKVVSKDVVPLMKKGSALILLDPAAAYANEVSMRDDCTFIVTHPCHPPIFGEQDTEEARNDLFGGIAAKQDIVIALVQGEENKLEEAETICMNMFAPVEESHRITVDQMAMLEPAAAEVVAASAACLMKEAIDEVIKRGVPEKAAWAFMLGHIQIPLAIVLKNSNPFSDAAKIAIDYGNQKIYKDNWREVFEKPAISEVIDKMLHSDS